MKCLFVAVLATCALIAASSPQPNQPTYSKEFLLKQKDVLRIFRFINQPSYYQDFVDIAQNYNIQGNRAAYTKPEVVDRFLTYYNHDGFLSRGEIFSVYYHEHIEQVKILFKLFYYAKDYQTFYQTAVWARNHLNEGLFLYTFSVALVHRVDTFGLILPPIYEIYPNYFYQSDVIQQAQIYKQQFNAQETSDKSNAIVYANYSGDYLNLHPEQSLSYYLEDVGINSFYYYYNLYYPSWLGGEEFRAISERRGEIFYYTYQQLLARFYLERLSNDFGQVGWYNWEVPYETGYVPSLRYPNGQEFPSRPNYAKLYEYFYNYGQKYSNYQNRYFQSYTQVQDYERRLRDVIDQGYIYIGGERVNLRTVEGIEYLGNLIDSNVDSLNNEFYGNLQSYARHLLGYSYQPYDSSKLLPSSLEHFETSLRDPAFYQFYKRIVYYFQNYKSYLPHYTETDLYFAGVRVELVEFDRLITYFDNFYADLSNGIYVNQREFNGTNFEVKARQQRLNHKPFTYRIKVTSDKDQDVVVRVYLGPKYDEYGRFINITENRLNFVQFDHFRYNLKSGQNVLERNSRQNYFYVQDRTSYYQLYKNVLQALESGNSADFAVHEHEYTYGFPLRYLLPRGSYNGHEYQFYVIVSPYVPYKRQYEVDYSQFQFGGYPGSEFIDGYPLGYPFDRPIYCEQFFQGAPNSYFYSTKIYHRSEEDINASTATTTA